MNKEDIKHNTQLYTEEDLQYFMHVVKHFTCAQFKNYLQLLSVHTRSTVENTWATLTAAEAPKSVQNNS